MIILRSTALSNSRLHISRVRFSTLFFILFIILSAAHAKTFAATWTVAAGGDLQAALNAAQPGDTIVIEAGASFIGPFTLPNKLGTNTDADWITIRTSAPDSSLPVDKRVTPAQAALMPKLLSPGRAEAALQTAPGAHHYRLIGIEFARTSSSSIVYDLVKLGDGSPAQNSLDKVPHHFVLDRCFIHGDSGNLKRGVSLQSAHTDILNCYISEFHVRGQEAQAVAGWNGPGPFRIINNFLEGAGENLIFGGAQAAVPNLVPSDILIARNHFSKQPSWRGIWTVKNILELKSARRVRIDGNLLEYCWLDAQQGYAVLFTPRPNDSGAWAVVEDVEFTNNIIRHVAAAMHFSGQDDLWTGHTTERRLHRVRVANNLFEEVNHERWGGDGCFIKMVSGADGVMVEHNTVVQTGTISKSGGEASTGYVFRDNIVRHNEYGVHGDGRGYGMPAIEAYMPGAQFVRNVIVKEANAPWNTEQVYPPGNWFPATLRDVGFIDLAGRNYRLGANSRYRRAATDGKDVGCDIDQLEAAMAARTTTHE